MTMKGMDIEAGRQSAQTIQQGSSELEQLTNTLTQSLEGFQWIGPDADRTRQTWQSEHRTALTNISHVDQFDLEFIGFSIEQWVLAMRGRLLTRLGRLEEARRCLDRLAEMGATSLDPVIVQMPHYGYVELAAHLNDAGLAKVHLEHTLVIADKHQNPYLRVFALNGSALLSTMQANYRNAAITLGEALSLVRNAKVATEFETEILANLAESHRLAGDLELALTVSKETVRLSRQRGNRLPQCRALITWGGILSADSRMGKSGEAVLMFEEAEKLIRATGAQGYSAALVSAGFLATLGTTPARAT